VAAPPAPVPAAEPTLYESRKATRRTVFRRDARYRRGLAAADVISATSAVTLGIAVLGDRDQLKPSLLLAIPLVVLVSKVIGLYDRDEHLLHKTTLDEVPAIFQVATLYTLLIWLTEGVSVQGHLGHTQILFLWSVLFVFMVAGRAASRWLVQLGTPTERCLVIGDALAARSVEQRFKQNRSVKAEVVGRVALNSHEVHGAAPPILGDITSLSRALAEHQIHRVVVAPGLSDSQEIVDVIRRVKLYGVKVSVLPRLFEVIGSSVKFDDIHGLTLLGMNRDGLTKSSEILKRAMDICGAAVGLTLLSPLLLAIAATIKLTSPGPVLFRQRRIGRDGAEFELLKFRTMVDGADNLKPTLFELNESDGFFKIADDPRVTRVGKFLRQTYLDELPQLINVLRGEMSLVGPRPLVPDEDVRIEGWQRNRLLLKPGMTGHWQIFGASRVPMREMVKIDYLYGANWSLWLDTKILLRTIPYVARRSGQ
jgi:exopolysaccharide biosynthesis polyprenyl glycosylphosphotransferase